MLKVLRWIVTNKCNYNCSICWQRQLIKEKKIIPEPEEKLDPVKYYEALLKLKPEVLDCTGGEPLIRKGFINLIKKICDNKNINIALTSNISRNIDDFVQNVNPLRISSLVCSFHPEFTSEKLFLGKLKLLKSYGFNPIVNFVISPYDIFISDYYINYFQNENFKVHTDIYSPAGTKSYTRNPIENSIIEKTLSSDRKIFLKDEITTCYCDAGSSVLQCDTNLDAYPCLRYYMEKLNPMGNIVNKEFSLLKKSLYCVFRKECAGCDRDHVTVNYEH